MTSERTSATAAWAVYSSTSAPDSAARPARQKRRQAGQAGVQQRADPSGDQRRRLGDRGPDAVDRVGQRRRVRVAVGQRDVLAGDDQRVLAGEVELVADGLLERVQRVVDRAVDLRLGSERVRVLDAERTGRRGSLADALEQLAHPRGDRRLTGPVAPRVDPWVEHDRIGGRGLERQRRDRQPGVEQPPRVDDQQRRAADR